MYGDRPLDGGAQRARHPRRSALPRINPADGGRHGGPPTGRGRGRVAFRSTIRSLQADAPLAAYQGGDQRTRANGSGRHRRATRLDANSAASQAYLAYLAGQHGALEAAIEAALGRSVTPIFTYTTVLNGIAIEMSAAEAGVVASLAGVTAVVPDKTSSTC